MSSNISKMSSIIRRFASYGFKEKAAKATVASSAPESKSSWKKWAYNLSGFNQYGLMHNDCYQDTDDLEEALRRLPQHLVDERNYRIMRAFQCSLTKTILPKHQWTKFEEDVRYLDPYLKEVTAERLEREKWENSH